MKKILLSILAAAALLISGCDTIETTTIRIALGNDRGTAAPTDVSTAHIGVYQLVDGWVEKGVASKTLSATGSTTVVVPANMDLYIIVMALNDTKDQYYFGYGYHYGAGSGGELEGEEMLSRADNSVYIEVFNYDASPAESFGVFSSESPGIDVYCYNTPNLPGYLPELVEMNIDRKTDDGSFKLLTTIDFDEEVGESGSTFVYFDPWGDDGMPVNGSYTYRVRLYVPLLGLYFYFWGEDSMYFGGK